MKREIVRNRTPAFEDQSQEGREEMENMWVKVPFPDICFVVSSDFTYKEQIQR
jgi:hypothetical protein